MDEKIRNLIRQWERKLITDIEFGEEIITVHMTDCSGCIACLDDPRR